MSDDSRSKAVLRGVEIAEEDLRRAGGAYDLEQVRILMRGISQQEIDKRVQEGSLLAVPGPNNQRRFPAFQFTRDGTLVSGLQDVREALQTENPWVVLDFLSLPDHRLDGCRPIDMLRAGKLDLVLESAKRHGEQGA